MSIAPTNYCREEGHLTYEQMLDQLDVAIGEVEHKIENGRIRTPEYDKVRIQYFRALGRYLIRSRLCVLEQRDLQKLKEILDELEADLVGGL